MNPEIDKIIDDVNNTFFGAIPYEEIKELFGIIVIIFFVLITALIIPKNDLREKIRRIIKKIK